MMIKINLKVMLTSCLIAMLIGRTAFTKTIYVDDDATGANDGSSWMNAYNWLQDALTDANSAEKPVEIAVAQGCYKPDQGRGKILHGQKATFQLINGVTLKGGFAGFDEPNPNTRDVNLYETILSGDLKGNDVDVNDPQDLLDESSRNDNSYCIVTSRMTLKTAVLDGFTITAGSHHGMCNKRGNPTVINCTFRGNRAERWGGGMCNNNGSPSLKRCTFSHNSAKYGGGIWNMKGSPVLTLCTFRGNSAKFGSAMYNYDNSHPQISNCTFSGNSAKYGAGIYNNKNCRPKVSNCTFTGNSADRKGGVIHNIHYSSLILTNSILWNNAPDENEIVNYVKSSSIVRYCNVQDGTGQLWFGEGCIDADPLFVGDDNLRLLPDSPCINAGDNTAVAFDIATDIDGKQCLTNNTVDMGAFEGE
ncbi:MAG: right-handed parallel beta-helix repeat-containing protein [Phycisphaerales bacterium]|nr:MAG: right-handed parallel beta-helix repeat-containing protein [Phycisphaerales bacterium]